METVLTFLTIVLVICLATLLLALQKLKERLNEINLTFHQQIFDLTVKYQQLECVKGTCQVNYEKDPVNRSRVYAFTFNGIEDLRQKLLNYADAQHIALFLKPGWDNS